MITYFPELYPDELLYSVFSRFYNHTGYLSYIHCAEDLYVNATVRPDIEFINLLKPEVKGLITKSMKWEDIILKHTMYSYYSRYLNGKRKDNAFKALLNMQGDYNNILVIPKNKEQRFLKYCPLCVNEDRERYGETYWHRKHQIIGIDLCSKHGCHLIKSNVAISSFSTPSLKSAESEVQEENIVFGNLELFEFIKYLVNVLEQNVYCGAMGEFLNSKLAGTPYLSKTGQQRKINLLHKDFMDFYYKIGLEYGVKEIWHLEKILNGYLKNSFEVCQLAYFLRIKEKELINFIVPDKSPKILFEEKVIKMIKEDGKGINETARELKVSSKSIRDILNNYGIKSKNAKDKSPKKITELKARIKQEREFWLYVTKKFPEKSFSALCKNPEYKVRLGFLRRNDKEWTDAHFPKKIPHKTPKNDWEQMDKEMLQIVKDTIKKLYGQDGGRPCRITEHGICRILGLPDSRFKVLPMCLEEIKKNEESQEVYWGREVIWAIKKLQAEGKAISWTNVEKLTNMRKKNFIACYPYLCEIAGKDIICCCKELLKS